MPNESVRGRSQSLSKRDVKVPLGQCKRAVSQDNETIVSFAKSLTKILDESELCNETLFLKLSHQSRSVSEDETNKQSSFETVTSPVPTVSSLSYKTQRHSSPERSSRPAPPRSPYKSGETIGQYYESLLQPHRHPVVRYSKSNSVYQSPSKLPEVPVVKSSGRSMYPRNHQSSYSYPSRPTMLQLQQPSLRRPFLVRQPPVQHQPSPDKMTDSSESDQHFHYSNEKLRSPNRSVVHMSPKRSAEYLSVPDESDQYRLPPDHRRSPMIAGLRAKSFEINDRRSERFRRQNKSLDAGGTFDVGDAEDSRDSPLPTEPPMKPRRVDLTSTDESDAELHHLDDAATEQVILHDKREKLQTTVAELI